MRLPRFRFSLLAAFLLFLAPLTLPAESIYFIGNSVTDTLKYPGFQAMAEAAGKTQPWGRQMIPGAPLEWLWNHPTDGFTRAPYNYPTNALSNYTWNALSLQPFDRSAASDLGYIQDYLGLLYGASSPTAAQSANRIGTRIFIMGRWPRQDNASRAGGPRDYDTLWARSYPEDGFNSNESADYAEDLTLAVRGVSVAGVSLQDRTFMVPVGHVMSALNQQMKAGQIAGLTSIFQIYADGIHLNAIGSYVTACTYYAVLYRETPVGLPVPSEYGTIAPALAAQIQETVWDVVQTETLSGVAAAGNLLLTTPAVPPAYVNQTYSTTLLAVGGAGPRTFAVSSGSLPNGISLGSNGVLSGTPLQSGDFAFSVTATDATSPTPLTATRAYNLRVDVNTTPLISTPAALPSVSRGGYYEESLVATGGNGQLTWTLLSGGLPPGLQLGAGGTLIGSALTEGNYTFTLRVSDTDIPADTDTRTFTLNVGPSSAETLLVARTLSPIRIDGALTETHWDLTHAAARTLLGTPDNTVTFAVLWDAENLYLAAHVEDSQLSNGAGTGEERDALEFFLDAFNDKQAEFNSQHRQFRIALDGALFERGGRSSGVKQAIALVQGGYNIEISVPWSNLEITPVAEQTVIGLDLANDDADSIAARQHYLAFAFADPTDPRPSQFGNAILTNTTVSGTGGEPLGSSGATPVLQESFDYSTGLLNGVGGAPSFGFNGTWQVEQANSPGYAIAGNESLAFGQLGTSGRYLTGGNTYQNSGRSLDMAAAFLPWKRAAEHYVGKDGTSLWISYLARPLKNTSTMKFSLDDSASVVHDNNGRLRVQQSGGIWRLSLMNDTRTAPTTVAVAANTTYLIVIRLDFGATDTATLYVNPVLGATPPATASSSATTTNANFRFNELQFYPGSSAGDGQFDELRMGASWKSVVPTPAQPVAPVTFSPLPGAYGSAPVVTLGTTTPGATIHYTTDGSPPTTGSSVYTTGLAINAATTIRALAVKSGLTDSVITGGNYTLLSPYQVWSNSIHWNSADPSPGADPNQDGISNLLAYALGADPLTNASDSLPTIATNGTVLSFSYVRERADITYSVQTSTSLEPLSWTTNGINQGSGAVGESINATTPVGSDTKRFLRLRVEQ